MCLAHGGSMGWLSPSLLVLQTDRTPLEGGPIDNETASWVGSTTYIGGICGNFMFMAILRYFGRKKTFCVLALPHLVSWIRWLWSGCGWTVWVNFYHVMKSRYVFCSNCESQCLKQKSFTAAYIVVLWRDHRSELIAVVDKRWTEVFEQEIF